MKTISREDLLNFLEKTLKNKLSKNETFELEDLIRKRCYYDLRLFAEIFFYDHCTKDFNPFHLEYFKNFDPTKKQIREAFAAPRGSAKTTLISLILAVHKICYNSEFLIILSSKDSYAHDKVRDIFNELNDNLLLKKIFNTKFRDKKSGKTDYEVETFSGRSRIKGQGIGSQIRGLKWGNKRPSSIILDDIEHSDRVWSEEQREKSMKHLMADVSKCGDENTNMHFIGTVLHRESVLSKLLVNPSYKSKIYKSIIQEPTNQDLWKKWKEIYLNLGDDLRHEKSENFYLKNKKEMDFGSQVFWIEKEDIFYLQKERLEIGKRNFQCEKQNNPVNPQDSIFSNISYFQLKKDEQGNKVFYIPKYDETVSWTNNLKLFLSVDPAHGQKKQNPNRPSDYSSFVISIKDTKDRVFVLKDFTDRISPSKQIKRIFDLHEKYNFNKIAVEINLFREAFREGFEKEKLEREKDLGYKLPYLPIEEIENKKNKEIRIHGIETKITYGQILFCKEKLSHEALNELQDYPNTEKDDFLDALEMNWRIANEGVNSAVYSI